MYLVSHYCMSKTKLILHDLGLHLPSPTVAQEPLMDMIFKKPKVDMLGGDSIKHQTSPGITCSLYPVDRRDNRSCNTKAHNSYRAYFTN